MPSHPRARVALVPVLCALVAAGCWTQVAITTTTPNRTLRSDELGQAIRATERVQLRGTAFLHPGRYELPELSGARLEVPNGAAVEFRVDVSVAPGDAPEEVSIAVETFTLDFPVPLVAARGFLAAQIRQLSVEQPAPEEALEVSAEIALGRSLALSLARFVIRGHDHDVADARGLLDRIVVDRMHLALRPDSALDVGGHHLVLAEGSHLIIKDAAYSTSSTEAVVGLLGVHLRLGPGTRLTDGRSSFELSEVASLDLSTSFERSAAGVALELAPRARDIGAQETASTESEPPREPSLEPLPGRLHVGAAAHRSGDGAASFVVEEADVRLTAFSLRGGRVRASLEGGAELGPSTIPANGGTLRVASAQVGELRLEGARTRNAEGVTGDDLRVRIRDVHVEAPALDWGAGDSAVTVSAASLEIPDLSGMRWDDLHAATGSLRFSGPRVAWRAPSGSLEASAEDVGVELSLGPTLSLSPDAGPPLEVSAAGEWSRIDFRQGETVATLTGVPMRVSVTSFEPLRGSAVLSARDVQLQDAGETVQAAIPSVRIQLAEQLSAQVEGARVSLASDRVLARAREGIPASYLSDITNVTNDLQSAAMNLIPLVQGRITDIGRYKEWSTQLQVDGLRDLQLSAQEGGIRITGAVTATAIVRANKQHIKTDICYRRVFGARIPYPCIRTWHSVVEVDRLRFSISVDGAVSVGTNAPAPLRDLALQLRPRFDYVNLAGLQNDIERILLRRTYDRLQDREISVPLGRTLATELGGLGSGEVQVSEATVEIDPARVSTRLSFTYGP